MRVSTVEAQSIDRATALSMFALFRDYYENVELDAFMRDLGEKKWVLLLHKQDELAGFTTIKIFDFEHSGTRNRILFSGDTIVRRDVWGDRTLAFEWIRQIGRVAREDPAAPLYWLLIVKGHRTYRYLPTFGLSFVPHWAVTAPEALASLRDALARHMFGKCYDPESGVVRFEEPQGNLKQRWAVPSARELRRPDVDFFLRSNPGYLRGDELVCLCSLARENMRPLARRLFDQGFRD